MAAGMKEIQLSRRGKLTDRFLRLTAKERGRGHALQAGRHPDGLRQRVQRRAVPPDARRGPGRAAVALHGRKELGHVRNLHEYLWLAYYPIGCAGRSC